MVRSPQTTSAAGRFSLALLVTGLLVCLGVAVQLTAGLYGGVGLVYVVLMDLPVAVAIFVAAGGWGWLLLRKLLPSDTPPALAVATSTATGLWLLSTATLITGSTANRVLTPEIGWPVIGIGISAAAWPLRKRILGAALPRRVPPSSLLWVVAVGAAAMWVAGAAMPAGRVGLASNDYYDVVSYHLQIPREFYEAGRITDLPHNTYSHYPLGGEMLFLLSMCLKGSASAGVFAAKFTHGLWGVLAAVTLYVGLPDTWRRRSAAAMLITTPVVLQLSWLAFVELSELAYLAVAVVWLRRWVEKPTWRVAAMIGLACGGACATKYLSVGLVAGPVLVVMLLACKLPWRRIAHAAVAAMVCVVLMSPWLIRNTIYTHNPVFPLATDILGSAHWSPEQTARWDAGHAPAPWDQKLANLPRPFVGGEGFGPFVSLMAAAAILFVAGGGRTSDPTDRICLGILVVQILAWTLVTHMPGRFLAPAAIPLCILAGGLCSRIARRGRPDGPVKRRWIPIVAVALAAMGGLILTCDLYIAEQRAAGGDQYPSAMHGMYPDDLTQLRQAGPLYAHLTLGTRLLLVGDATAFNFPRGTAYATAWEADPLVRIASETSDPAEIIRRLRLEYRITHVLVNWSETDRLLDTYGWWDTITPELIDSLRAAGARDIPLGAPTWYNGRPMAELLLLP